MFNLKFFFTAIGDQVGTTGIPENLFNATGQRCCITDKRIWAFKYNPYVDHCDQTEVDKDALELSMIPDARSKEQAEHYKKTMGCDISTGQLEYMLVNLGITTVKLRHPRLYVYEDVDIKPYKVVINTNGSDRTLVGEPAIRPWAGEDSVRIMSDQVLESIRKNYRDYEIVQVGSATDKPMLGNFVDLRGKLDYWGSAREIAEAAIFIGVNSGPMHIANCYPRTVKKIVLQEFPEDSLKIWRPEDTRNFLFSWIDPSNIYYNKFDFDCGITFSHSKI